MEVDVLDSLTQTILFLASVPSNQAISSLGLELGQAMGELEYLVSAATTEALYQLERVLQTRLSTLPLMIPRPCQHLQESDFMSPELRTTRLKLSYISRICDLRYPRLSTF
jgi:hypothetical protein